jgi:RNA polymerase sigma-70 factor (ECF subfamily)
MHAIGELMNDNLFQRCEHPSHSIFERLYSAHFAFVQRTVQRCGVPPEDAADVTQEIFLKVYGCISSYDVTRPARSWLYAFAIHLASDYRALARHRHEMLHGMLPEVPDDAPSAEHLMRVRDERETLRQRIGNLKPDLRAVLNLHEMEEKSMPEVVKILRMPLDTGYTKLRRAREALRRHVARAGVARRRCCAASRLPR